MKKPIGYNGYAWNKPEDGYSEEYLKSAEGKKEIKKQKKKNKKYRKFYKENGFDPTETWNLDVTITKFILPRLKYFRENLHSYPPNSEMTFKKWGQILDTMIEAFEETLVEAISYDKNHWDERNKRVQEGLQLFAKYYENLWD